jgi:hypothetical protein
LVVREEVDRDEHDRGDSERIRKPGLAIAEVVAYAFGSEFSVGGSGHRSPRTWGAPILFFGDADPNGIGADHRPAKGWAVIRMRQENVTCPTCGDTVTVGVVLTEVEPSMLPEEAGEMPSPIEESPSSALRARR